eukprot:TRINITY_DN1970_c0_g2_i1.p1 TRINITY_DN1970_c0_g2~~TRINITY_DN1970_c0_g2_i1.p1  ORF type:complete len:144 (-),score=9.30 TRINITY_DN1970_c0_g2_i1:202-633(-)
MAPPHSNPDDQQISLTLKFRCSYAGKILPRYSDAKLRYVGGQTRILSVNRFITFSELSSKLRDLCGFTAITLKCQLPNEDLDALVSVKSDEDLANIIDEYDGSSSSKIKAFISPLKPKISAGKSVSSVGIRSVPGRGGVQMCS